MSFFRVKNCFAFNKHNDTVLLTDDRGCPFDEDIVGPFVYDEQKGVANAQIKSMFRFPDSTEVHFQVFFSFSAQFTISPFIRRIFRITGAFCVHLRFPIERINRVFQEQLGTSFSVGRRLLTC